MSRRGFGHIRKLPSGRWRASYLDPVTGVRIAAPTTFSTKSDANAWLSSIQTDHGRGELLDPRLADGRSASGQTSGSTRCTSDRARCRLRGRASTSRLTCFRDPTDLVDPVWRLQEVRRRDVRQGPRTWIGQRGAEGAAHGSRRSAEGGRHPSEPRRWTSHPSRQAGGDGLPLARRSASPRRRSHATNADEVPTSGRVPAVRPARQAHRPDRNACRRGGSAAGRPVRIHCSIASRSQSRSPRSRAS